MANSNTNHEQFDFQLALDQLDQDETWSLSYDQLRQIFRTRVTHDQRAPLETLDRLI